MRAHELPSSRFLPGLHTVLASAVVLVSAACAACGTSSSAGAPAGTELVRAALARLEQPPEGAAVLIHASGTMNQSAELQGRRPFVPVSARLEESIGFLPDGGASYELDHERLDGGREWTREVYAPDSRTIHVLHEGFSVRFTDPVEIAQASRVTRRLPAVLLREVLDAARVTLEQGPTGDPWTLLAKYRSDSLPDLELSFEAADTTLRSVSYPATLPGKGDAEIRWSYGDYRPVAGFGRVPHIYGVTVGGVPFIEMRVDSVTTNEERVRQSLESPPGFDPPFDVPAAGDVDAAGRGTVDEVADGVFVIRNLRAGFHPMFIELADAIVAIDAPAGYPLLLQLPAGDVAPGPAPDWLSRRYIELIRQTVPDKPIEFVVLTHFHNDHAGGVRAFVAEGATVLLPEPDEDAMRSYHRAPHSGAPDALIERPAPLELETVRGRRTITDGVRRVEVLSVGRNPHTDDMLVVYVEPERILFVSDLMAGLAASEAGEADLTPTQRFFVEWLASSGLDPVRVFAMHGSEAIDRSALERASSPE